MRILSKDSGQKHKFRQKMANKTRFLQKKSRKIANFVKRFRKKLRELHHGIAEKREFIERVQNFPHFRVINEKSRIRSHLVQWRYYRRLKDFCAL